MFRRVKNNQKQNKRNGRNPGNAIHEGPGADDLLLNIGNEASIDLNSFLNLGSNESNNDSLAHYTENDLNKYTLKTDSDNKPIETPPEIVKEGLAGYYENDLNNLTLNKPKVTQKNKRKKTNLINKPVREGMAEKDYSDDSFENSFDDDHQKELIEPLIKEKPEEILNIINDKIDIGSEKQEKKEKKKAKSSKKSKKAAAPKAAAPQINEDLTQVDESMEPVQGWDFTAQKLPARKKQGWLSKLGSWAAYYSGKTIGKLGGLFAWLGKSLWGLVRPGPGTLGGTFKRMRGSSKFEQRRDRDLIPGWDGAKYSDEPEEEKGNNDDIDMDFRRIPEIWSWPTAAKAAEGDEADRNSKPVDPVISVYVSQASRDYTITKDGSTGHTGIGVEYSRYSAMSGRWQRYNLRFGYYIGGGGASLLSKMAVSSYNNATIPGKVMDEKDRQYDISRSFAAKPKQVSDVLRAAENYADRGGYNQYTRNCTTFAKEMVVDVANIKGAEGIFAKDEIHLPTNQDAKLFGAGALAPIFKADMENGFEKMRTRDDLDYRNYGSKMASREDYEQYKNSLSLWSSRVTEGYSPNATAENMKRTEGGKSGQIGFFDTIDNGLKSYDNAPISVVIQQLVSLVSDLKTTLSSITPLDQLTSAKMTPELQELMSELDSNKILTDLIVLFPKQQDEKLFAQKTKQSDLVKGRTMMTDLSKKLNTLLFRYYRNDKRVQKKVLKIINALNHGINAIDNAYVKTEENDLTAPSGELKDIQKNFGSKNYKFTVKGKPVELTASEYEAWLQVFGTPDKALENYSKFYTLKNKRRAKQTTDAEDKELEKLTRIYNLTLDFERSHRYMLTKEKYNQQDVDYAFSLGQKERQGGVDSTMFEQDWNDPTMTNMKNPSASAAGTYKMLIMKGVFGGMQDRFSNEFKDDAEGKDNKNITKEMVSWISADAADCIRNHQKEMKTIIRAMKRTTDKPDQAKLRAAFINLLTQWLFHSLRKDKDPNQYRSMIKSLTSYKSEVIKEADKVIEEVMEED